MPVSKNRRKSKKAQSRKVNRAKVAGNVGGGGVYDTFDYPPPEAPQGAIPGSRPPETSIGGNRRYQVTSPDGPALSELEQIDAIIERSVTFEMTEPHHDNIGLREIDLDGEMGGGGHLCANGRNDKGGPSHCHRRPSQVADRAGVDRLLGLRPQRVQGRVRRQPVAGERSQMGRVSSQRTGLFVPSGARSPRDPARMRAVRNGVATGGGPLSLPGRKQHPDNVRRVLVEGSPPGRGPDAGCERRCLMGLCHPWIAVLISTLAPTSETESDRIQSWRNLG